MIPELSHRTRSLEELRPDDLVLAYREPEDYEANSPELDGAIRLVHESRPGVWDVQYRTESARCIDSGPINLNDFARVCVVFADGDSFIGRKYR